MCKQLAQRKGPSVHAHVWIGPEVITGVKGHLQHLQVVVHDRKPHRDDTHTQAAKVKNIPAQVSNHF